MTQRINVTLPDELAALVRDRLPGLNVSGVLQAALRELVECPHDRLGCVTCGATITREQLVDAALSAFYREVMWQLAEPVGRCATAEGAARVVASVAESWAVSATSSTPLPRPTRSQREFAHRALVNEAREAEARQYEAAEQPRRRRARKAA